MTDEFGVYDIEGSFSMGTGCRKIWASAAVSDEHRWESRWAMGDDSKAIDGANRGCICTK